MIPLSRGAATGGIGTAEGADVQRRLANLLRQGQVAEVQYAPPRIRVRSGDLLTAWIPWLAQADGNKRVWAPPAIGQPVTLLSPGGELENAVALPGTFSSAHAAPADSGEIDRTTHADGAVIEYDRAAHRLAATLPEAGEAITTIGAATVSQKTTEIRLAVAGASITITAGEVRIAAAAISLIGENTGRATATLRGDFHLIGTLTGTEGDITAEAISLRQHHHTGVQSGSGQSGTPV